MGRIASPQELPFICRSAGRKHSSPRHGWVCISRKWDPEDDGARRLHRALPQWHREGARRFRNHIGWPVRKPDRTLSTRALKIAPRIDLRWTSGIVVTKGPNACWRAEGPALLRWENRRFQRTIYPLRIP